MFEAHGGGFRIIPDRLHETDEKRGEPNEDQYVCDVEYRVEGREVNGYPGIGVVDYAGNDLRDEASEWTEEGDHPDHPENVDKKVEERRPLGVEISRECREVGSNGRSDILP